MSTIILQPFPSYDKGLIPPPFEYDSNQSHIELDDEHIISMRDGLILSRYGDDIWDLTPYSTKEFNCLYFKSIISPTLKMEAKRLTYLTMTHATGKNRTSPSGATVMGKYYSFIKPLAEYIQGLPIKEEKKNFNYMLAHVKHLRHYILSYTKNKPSSTAPVISILKLLKENSKKRTGFEYVSSKRTEQALVVIDKHRRNSLKQTILMPVSIYIAAANMRWEHISAIEPYSKGLAYFIEGYANCKGFGAKKNKSLSIEERKDFVKWDEAVKKYALITLFKQYKVMGLADLFRFIHELQGTCRHLIHQYTGMRENECRSLNCECWKDENDTMPARIHGIEQKIHGVPTHQVWITHNEIKRVVNLLKSIGAPIAKRCNPKLKKPPLSIKISKLKNREVGDNHYKVLCAASKIKELAFSDLKSITITQEHINEMSLVDNRDWSEHEWVKEGATWRFATHQYRRALAIYSLGSELVSLHAVKEQFGHLLSAMTNYYGNGHKSARRLDGSTDDKDHISSYINKIRKDIMFYLYKEKVLLSKVPLYGANGMFLDKHIVARTVEEREVVMHNSDKMKKNFKKSGQYYEETAVGGCTKSDCEKRLLPVFFLSFYCKSCDHSIHRLEKVERLTEKVRLATMKYAEIQPNGVDHRTMVKIYNEVNHFTKILRRKEHKETSK